MADDILNIEINGEPFEARKGQMLIEVADANGITIPRFCYHKKLTVAANCRMCLVEVERAPKPLPACATPVMDGMKVFTRSALALKAQKSVMEFLLINHPLDCPICDQGGECELQDVAMGYGRDISRFVERKRVVEDKDLGPLISTDMTRCIHCTRCVRFCEEIGGMPELGVTGRGENVEIGTFIRKNVDSELSGNVIDLCPVGALTSKPFRFRARSWEMQQRPSVSPHDPFGTNLYLHVRRNQVMRVVPRDNEAINESWIADRDRYSYEGLYAKDRLLTPRLKRDGEWADASWEDALAFVAEGVSAARNAGSIGALSAPGATLEEHYLLQKLVRGLGGRDVDHRVRQTDFSGQAEAAPYPSIGMSIDSLESLDAVLLIGSSTRKEHPLVNHRLRKASANGAAVMYLDTHGHETNLKAAHRIVAGPKELIARLAGICEGAGVDGVPQGGLTDDASAAVAAALADGERTAILIGPQGLNHPHAGLVAKLAERLAERTGATLGVLSEGGNAAGAWLAGMVPHREAGGAAAEVPGANAGEMLDAKPAAMLLLGLEPEFDCANASRAMKSLRECGFVVSLSAYRTEAIEGYADAILPIAAFAETSGTFVNLSGEWQGFAGAVSPPGEARPAWKILRVLGNLLDVDGFDYVSSEEIRDEVAVRVEEAQFEPAAPSELPAALPATADGIMRIGATPIYHVDPIVRRATALQATTDGADSAARLNPALLERLGITSGSRAVVSQGESHVEMEVTADAAVPDGCAYVPTGVPQTAGLGASYGEISIEAAS